jgi:hypothetical protein
LLDKCRKIFILDKHVANKKIEGEIILGQRAVVLTGIERMNLISIPIKMDVNEASDYHSGSTQDGFGQAVDAGIQVTKGVHGTFKYALEMSMVLQNDFTDYKNTISSWLDESENAQLSKHVDSSSQQAGYVCASLGWFKVKAETGSASSSSYNEFVNTHRDFHANTGTQFDNALQKLHSFDNKKVKVSGTLDVWGTSNIPSTAYVFIRVLQIKFADGHTINVVDETPNAGNSQGDVLPSKGEKMNIVPIGS